MLKQQSLIDTCGWVPDPDFDGPHKLGYVNRALLPTVSYWLRHKTVRAQVERKNGKPERPLIYIRLRIE